MIWDAFYLHGGHRQKVTTQDNNPGIIWDHQQLKTTSLTALFFYKVFIFVYFWTGTVMLGSLACVPVNYVHRQPALFLHKVILTIYFSDISRYFLEILRYYIPTGPLTMSTDSLPLFAQSKLDNLQSWYFKIFQTF